MNNKKDVMYDELEENVISFGRLFVLFEYHTHKTTSYAFDELSVFYKLYVNVTTKLCYNKPLDLKMGDNFVHKVVNLFDVDKRTQLLTIKDEYIERICTPEIDEDFINIRKELFTIFFDNICNDDTSLKHIKNLVMYEKNKLNISEYEVKNGDENIIS